MSTRIYLDLEYCYPGMTKQTGRPSKNDKRQVVQIAAICYDNSVGKELSSFDILTAPKYAKVLPDFFTELTGITQDQVDQKSVVFSDAFEKLILFCGDSNVYTFDKDWYVLRQNCGYHKINFAFEKKPFIRISGKLDEWGLNQNKYSSGTLYKAAGLRMEGHVHNALHDVRSMAAATFHFDNDQM